MSTCVDICTDAKVIIELQVSNMPEVTNIHVVFQVACCCKNFAAIRAIWTFDLHAL